MPTHNGLFLCVIIPKARSEQISSESFNFITGSIISMLPHKRSFLSDLLSIFFVENLHFFLCDIVITSLERSSLNEI